MNRRTTCAQSMKAKRISIIIKCGCATVNKKEKIVEDLRKKGLINEEYKKNYGFPYIMKLCREYKVCDFKEIKIGKKHIKNDKELTNDLGKRALMITFL